MTTSTCFIRQEAPECSTATSEMEAIKPAQLIGCAGSAFEAAPRQEVRISASWGWTFSWLMEQASCLSAGRDCYRKGRVFTAHCPRQQNKTDCHPRVFLQSFRFGLFHLLPPLSLFIFKNRECLGSTKQVPWQKGSWTLKLNGYFSWSTEVRSFSKSFL